MKILSLWTLWSGLLIIIVLSLVFYLFLTSETKTSVTQQLFSQGQIISRAESNNTTTYLQKFGDSVAILSQLSNVEHHNKDVIQDLNKFVDQEKNTGLVGGVVLTDKAGVVEFNSNVLGTKDQQQSLADRDYFSWAKSHGEIGKYFISQPVISRLGATKGQTIVVVASPVYLNGKFTGVVAASLKLQTLVGRFFGLMKISDLTNVYLIDGQGDLLYSSSRSDMVGSNISELFSNNHTISGDVLSVLGRAEEGQFKTDEQLITYSQIALGTQKWLLIISSPAQEVTNLTKPIYIRQISVLLLTIFSISLFGVIVIKKNQFPVKTL